MKTIVEDISTNATALNIEQSLHATNRSCYLVQ